MSSPRPASSNDATAQLSQLRQNAPQRSTIDGVVTLFAASGGTTRASLSFRVGTADEPLAQRGVTHLIGHLASAAAGQDDAQCPVTVSASTTTFHFTGNALAVANEVGAVCHWIGSAAHSAGIDGRALDRSRSAAAADARDHAPEHTGLLAARFGPQGWAGGGMPELGLTALDRDAIAAWVRRYFTRANAVLAISGTKATTLRVPLPRGERQDFPPVGVTPLITPALIPADTPRLSAGALLPTSGATLDRDRISAALASEIAHFRAARALARRFDRDVHLKSGTMSLGETHVHLAWWADVSPEQEAKAADLVAEAFEKLAADGPSDDEPALLAKRRATALDRVAADPAGSHRLLTRQSIAALNDTQWSSALERRLLHTVDAAELAARCTEVGESLLIQLHDVTPPIRAWSGPASAPAFDTSATAMRSRPAYSRDRSILARLHLDDEGITVRRLDDREQLRWADVVLTEAWDGGRRRLTGLRGHRIDVRPETWNDPDTVVAGIDRAVPAASVVRVDSPAPTERTRESALNRLPASAWAALSIAAVIVLAIGATPLLPETASWLRWLLITVGAVGIVICGALSIDRYRTERAFARNNAEG